MVSREALLQGIHSSDLALSEAQMEMAAQFGAALYRANEEQNLTRIVGVEDFVRDHLLDSVELLGLPTLGKSILDIGSGSGVPGLLAAAIAKNQERDWVLTESEARKAQFLEETRASLGLERVKVYAGRAETSLNQTKPDTVIARAVGTVEKIAGWIWNCSTWNTLILFKSKGWAQEWEAAQQSRFGKKLTIIHTHDYSYAGKTRLLITLKKKNR